VPVDDVELATADEEDAVLVALVVLEPPELVPVELDVAPPLPARPVLEELPTLAVVAADDAVSGHAVGSELQSVSQSVEWKRSPEQPVSAVARSSKRTPFARTRSAYHFSGTCRGLRREARATYRKFIASQPPSELNPHATCEKNFALRFT